MYSWKLAISSALTSERENTSDPFESVMTQVKQWQRQLTANGGNNLSSFLRNASAQLPNLLASIRNNSNGNTAAVVG